MWIEYYDDLGLEDCDKGYMFCYINVLCLECTRLIVIDFMVEVWDKTPNCVIRVWFVIVIRWMNVYESDCNYWSITDMSYCWINCCYEWVVCWIEVIESDYWDEMCLIVIDWMGEFVW